MLDFHYARREQLYDFLATVSRDDFVRPMGVGWSDIRGTLVHCLRAEDFWIEHGIQGGERVGHDPGAYPTIDAVMSLAGSVRERTESWFAAVTERELARECTVGSSTGEDVPFVVGDAVFHVVAHDVHHRGEVIAMLRILGYDPPWLDYL